MIKAPGVGSNLFFRLPPQPRHTVIVPNTRAELLINIQKLNLSAVSGENIRKKKIKASIRPRAKELVFKNLIMLFYSI